MVYGEVRSEHFPKRSWVGYWWSISHRAMKSPNYNEIISSAEWTDLKQTTNRAGVEVVCSNFKLTKSLASQKQPRDCL